MLGGPVHAIYLPLPQPLRRFMILRGVSLKNAVGLHGQAETSITPAERMVRMQLIPGACDPRRDYHFHEKYQYLDILQDFPAPECSYVGEIDFVANSKSS